MWTGLAHFIIKYRLALLIALAVVTIFMATKIKNVELSYSFAKVVPANDPDMIMYEKFKSYFGEDGNALAIGIKDSSVYKIDNFRKYSYLSDEIARINGVTTVLSVPLLKRLVKNQAAKKFELENIFLHSPENQSELDSMLAIANDQKFYSDQIINQKNGATLILATLDKEVLNSKNREKTVSDIEMAVAQFEENTGVSVHLTGLPFVRSAVSTQVKEEMQLFLVLSIVVTGLILLFFFRSWDAVVFPLLIIGVVVIWVLGSLAIFQYSITLLTGLIPPIIVVIGIPNSIYLLNRYHYELTLHGNKMLAISRVTRKIGMVTFITNTTTAVGFMVLAFTDIRILKEFGIIASVNIMATFLVSMILIPGVFSWLPEPAGRQLKYIHFKPIRLTLRQLDILVRNRKYTVLASATILFAISIVGVFKIESSSYMVDDIPAKSKIKEDLAFFEQNFNGIMPLELFVDTGKKGGAIRQDVLSKVNKLENFLSKQEWISPAVSILSFVKASRQAFYNNNPAYYSLPNSRDRNFILRYFRNEDSQSKELLESFVDSTGQIMRISLKVADVGSIKLDSLVKQVIRPEVEAIFSGSSVKVAITGATLLFVKGNRFLIDNLQVSLLLAFVIIAVIMAILFASLRMVLICFITNLLPLFLIAGIMGYFGVPLKPSTALIFSIVFGISVDDSIHFLAKYRQELFANNFLVPLAVSKSIKETGASMMYTSIVLFAGFVIFSFSQFGGTVALGILTSITLVIAMFTNLILLPVLLLIFQPSKYKKEDSALIEEYQEFYTENDDEEISLDLMQIKPDKYIPD